MPLRPFPLPISIGTDIIAIPRIRAILGKGDENTKRYIRRFLRPAEQRQFLHAFTDCHTDERAFKAASHFLAGRWAAKEATIKAVTSRKLRFHDILIRRQPYGGGAVHAIILDRTAFDESELERKRTFPASNQDRGQNGRGELFNESCNGLHASSAEVLTRGLPADAINEIHPEERQERLSTPPSMPEQENPTGSKRYLDDGDIEELSGQIAQISISHDGSYATAVCLAAQEPMHGDVGGELAARNL